MIFHQHSPISVKISVSQKSECDILVLSVAINFFSFPFLYFSPFPCAECGIFDNKKANKNNKGKSEGKKAINLVCGSPFSQEC